MFILVSFVLGVLSKVGMVWLMLVGIVGDELREPEDFHTEMERRLRMNW